jgi:hypothetical protein
MGDDKRRHLLECPGTCPRVSRTATSGTSNEWIGYGSLVVCVRELYVFSSRYELRGPVPGLEMTDIGQAYISGSLDANAGGFQHVRKTRSLCILPLTPQADGFKRERDAIRMMVGQA